MTTVSSNMRTTAHSGQRIAQIGLIEGREKHTQGGQPISSPTKLELIADSEKYKMRVVSVLQEGGKSAACGFNQSMRCLYGNLLWREIPANQDIHVIVGYLKHFFLPFLSNIVNQDFDFKSKWKKFTG